MAKIVICLVLLAVVALTFAAEPVKETRGVVSASGDLKTASSVYGLGFGGYGGWGWGGWGWSYPPVYGWGWGGWGPGYYGGYYG